MADYTIGNIEQLQAYLQALRKTQGLTQQDLADRLGVSRPRVSKIERSPGDVTLGNLLPVLTALGVQLMIRDPNNAEKNADIPTPYGSW
ncbi:helix-turn-helix domain-containing protein [Gemmatimonas sp.]|jgi:HTH-type transcriptional regulator/antitoxin HipB|uniref:helix-turn-helix domain-containing protein n=1 Tax=Gemmatimonas sp. TaxID=1962908 RepID=UPI0037BE239E